MLGSAYSFLLSFGGFDRSSIPVYMYVSLLMHLFLMLLGSRVVELFDSRLGVDERFLKIAAVDQ